MLVKLYLHDKDYAGKTVQVKQISFKNGHGSITLVSGNKMDCPANYVILETSVHTFNHATGELIIRGDK